MEAFNLSPFSFAYLPGRVDFPAHSLTVIVKGTFTLGDGEAVALAAEQPFPTGDEPYPDDDEGLGAPRYENDFAPYKPRADVLLVGHCHAPGDQPVPMARVTLAVGALRKSLAVIGDRRWQGLMRGWTDPEPFRRLPLRYERAYGGPGYRPNPCGKGHGPIKDAEGNKVHPLPNVEDPARLISGKSDAPPPAGFGPLGRMWQERFARVGSYKGDWKEVRFPAVAQDFDWEHFNAAPVDQRVDGYLQGDEEIALENLRPGVPLRRCRLPGHRVQAWLEEEAPGPDQPTALREVPLNLDTLWIDADAGTLVLVWRGVAPVPSEDLAGIRHLLIAPGTLADPALTDAQARVLLTEAVAEHQRAWGLEPEPEPDPADDLPPGARRWADRPLDGTGTLDATDTPDATGTPDADRDETDAAAAGPLDRAEVERRLEAGEPLAGVRLRGLDLAGLQAAGAVLAGADLAGACLAGADLTGADLTGADLAGADLTGARAADAVCDQARLAGAHLTGLHAPGLSLVEALLDAAVAREAVLDGADFTGASLAGADLAGASLADANWAGVHAPGVCLERARAAGLRVTEGCELGGARLRELQAPESLWPGAVLKGADLAHASLQGADFTDADLQEAVLDAADLRFGRLPGANLRAARLRRLDLFQGSLEGADLTDADLGGSNLFEVEFLDAVFQNTVGQGANLKRTKQDRS